MDKANNPEPAGDHRPRASLRYFVAGIALIVSIGIALRISAALQSLLAVDEAESCINALTILQHGYPTSEYLSLPIYENTLTVPWYGNPEYEFRDSSYSSKGVATYHAWLPLYSIAAALAMAGIEPDVAQDSPRLRSETASVLVRTMAPRLPAIVFAIGFLLLICRLAWQMAGPAAAMVAVTWAALSAPLVSFGYQARYYSLTFLITTAVALALWAVWRRGRWRDFLLLGTTEGLLFHTHQLSAVVLAQIALLSFPLFIHHEKWLTKSAVAAGIAGLLILSWVYLTGFLETVSTVPKAHELFTTWSDWLFFPTRPASLIIPAVALIVLQCAQRSPRWLPRPFCQRAQELFPTAALLIGWLLAAYLVMQFLAPAASYLAQRRSLMLQVPGILLLSLVIGAIAQAASHRWSGLIAVGLTVAILWGSGKLAVFHGFRSTFTEAPLASALATRTFEPGTRFYATPNMHLPYTYYTGLPIQSVAPVRRSFFDSYEGPIVFIEHRHMPVFPQDADLIQAANRAGHSLGPEQIAAFRNAIWIHQVLADLEERGLSVPDPQPLPAYLEGVLAATRARWNSIEESYIRRQRAQPLFRDIDVETAADLWMSSFFRFVDYQGRLGSRSNIFSRLQHAEVDPQPESSAVIFYCPPLRSRETADLGTPHATSL